MRPEPVVQHTNGHALTRALCEGVRELRADAVGLEDVVFEVDPALGSGDGGEPVVVRGVAVEQEREPVAASQRRARRPTERALAEGSRGVRAFGLGLELRHAVCSLTRPVTHMDGYPPDGVKRRTLSAANGPLGSMQRW